MKKLLALMIIILNTIAVNAQCTDLFFSEYIKGSSNNKALEIYNPTNSIIDLSDYTIHKNTNGNATSSINFVLFGNLAPGEVYVVSNSQATGNIPIESDTVSGLTTFNGDDALWLQKISTGDTLDIIGEIGIDPGSSWPVGTGSTLNHTLIRKIGVQGGQTDWTIGATEWDAYPQDMDDSLGFHTTNACIHSCFTTYHSILVSACDNYTSPSGLNYMLSGTFNDTIMNVGGCDSVLTIHLTINHSSSSTDSIVACNSYTWLDGITYTNDNNTATHTLTNAVGCDSVLTIHLTINHSSSSTDSIVACNSYTWLDGITYTNDNNTATHTLTNTVGCDSVITLNLRINLPTSSTIITSHCGAFTDLNGFTWTADTVITNTFVAANGCDSVQTITLTIYELTNTIDVITTCETDYTWLDGNTYTSDNNTATMVYNDANGCDSILTLDLTFNAVDVTVNITPESLSANQNNATYQWLDCNNNYAMVTGQTGQTLAAPTISSYAVEVTYNGCTDTSMCYNAGPNPNGISDFNVFIQVDIFPNPSQTLVTIAWENAPEFDLEIFDITGKKVISKNGIQESKYSFNHKLPSGIYFIKINAEGQSMTQKLIVN
ncbi:hypothetical protein DNU06_11070 [Putridiphycobacter roseus]|uniref:LTD domain-containing protein n=1 Tax=Putridiphycobacter roseus TaxID=2219161 RepID=A0A2W1MZU1_9FLAO|nr:T9SS type A sorting domain-containing protein [Putridiphycobacter roseus]PZE16790.1 hypothetical protein DNU06_11070 [Putridiphycobacter roseus]